MAETIKDKIIQVLITQHNINRDAIDDALLLQGMENISFEKALITKGLIEESELLSLMARELNIPFINLQKYKIDPSLKELIPEKFARQNNIIPLSDFDKSITVGMSNPLDILITDDIHSLTGKQVDIVLGTEEAIRAAIDSFYGEGSLESVTDLTRDIEVDDFEIIVEKFPDLEIPFAKLLAVGDAYHEISEYERSYLVFRAATEASFMRESRLAGFLESQGEFLRSVDVMSDLLRQYPPEPYLAAATYALAQRVYAKAPEARSDAKLRDKKITRVDLIRDAWSRLDAFLSAYPEDPAAEGCQSDQ